LPFVKNNTSGITTQQLNIHNNLYYNSVSGILHSSAGTGGFAGNLQGTATVATNLFLSLDSQYSDNDYYISYFEANSGQTIPKANSKLKYNPYSDTLTVQNIVSNVSFENTGNNSVGGELKIGNTRGGSNNGQDGDESGTIIFKANDSTGQFDEFVKIKASVESASSTSEIGKLQIQVSNSNSNNASSVDDILTITGSTSAANSTTVIAGKLTVVGTVTQGSDIKLKENIMSLENSLDKVNKLRGVSFTRKDCRQNRKYIGLIAQEIEEVYPEFVETDEKTDTKSVNYASIVAPLIESVKTLTKKNSDLETENKTLKQKLDEQQDTINSILERLNNLEN